MPSLGKCLVFYFRYQPEMIKLYWNKQQPEEIADAEIHKMVNAVGNQCCEDVATFLSECGVIIERHFCRIGRCVVGKPNSTKWIVSSGIWMLSGNKPAKGNWKMQAGVSIPRNKAEIIPWIWATGKNVAEDRMVQLFGDAVKRSSDVDLPAGTVALAQIPILLSEGNGFEVASDEALAQVEKAFHSISQLHFENVYSFVKGLKG
ncbi:MAG TPA: hypothetical protein VFE62_11225 [Gemmataceae bacterium]|nr:hypothetical protein [Gemmataceae bacterium]